MNELVLQHKLLFMYSLLVHDHVEHVLHKIRYNSRDRDEVKGKYRVEIKCKQREYRARVGLCCRPTV